MPARPLSPPPPFLCHYPLQPYSLLFITGSWVVEEGPLCIVLAFPGSNPLHKVDGREPGKPAGTFELWRELLRFWMGSGHWEALIDVLAWNTTSQSSVTPSWGRLFFSKVEALIMVFYIIHKFICLEHAHFVQLERHKSAWKMYCTEGIKHSQSIFHINIFIAREPTKNE